MSTKHQTKVCENCDVTFFRGYNVGQSNWNRRRFCSNACKAEASRGPEPAIKTRRLSVGALNPQARLSEHQVRRIHADPRPYPEIAEMYEISRATISAIKCGDTWKHLNLPPVRQRASFIRSVAPSIGAEAHV